MIIVTIPATPEYGKSHQRRRINNSLSYLIVNPLLPFDKAPCSSFAVMSPLLSVSTLSQSNNTTMHAFVSSTTYWQISTCWLLTNGVCYLSFHRCQHQRTKKCDKGDEQAGKGGTMQTQIYDETSHATHDEMHTKAQSSIFVTTRVYTW